MASTPSTPANEPTVAAMRAAKALYPQGVGTYCFDTEAKEIEARERDWKSLARRIDAATRLPSLIEACNQSLAVFAAGAKPEDSMRMCRVLLEALKTAK